MGRLEEIAAAHGPDVEKAREKESRAFKRRMEEQAKLAEARRWSMGAARRVTGKVIFPARWTAERFTEPTYGGCIRCTTRWEGLRFDCRFYDRENKWTRLFIQTAGQDPVLVDSEAGLAAVLREWGLA